MARWRLSTTWARGGASAQGTTAREVAILMGTVRDGGTIPLPHYAAGAKEHVDAADEGSMISSHTKRFTYGNRRRGLYRRVRTIA